MKTTKNRTPEIISFFEEYSDIDALYKKATTNPFKVLMGTERDTNPWGRYFPDRIIRRLLLSRDHSRLTPDINKRKYTYYFDELERISMMERYEADCKTLIERTYYIYKENETIILTHVCYGKHNRLIMSVIFYENNLPICYVEKFRNPKEEIPYYIGYNMFCLEYGNDEVTTSCFSVKPKTDVLVFHWERTHPFSIRFATL